MIGCTEEPAPIAVTAVTLDSTSMTLIEGESQKLTASVSPYNAENKEVIWTSSNSTVASVKDGLVTASKAGTATITVKTDDGGKTATCEVTVAAKVYPVEGVSLDKTSYEITEGDEFSLTATVMPDNATNKNISWSSSNTSIAVVNDGNVTALKPGNATITVKSEDGGKTATCEVSVVESIYAVESVALDVTTAEIIVGDELMLVATVYPDNATNKGVTWSSSDEKILTVSDGKVTTLNVGVAVVTVKTIDGEKTANCEINVLPRAVESVGLDPSNIELRIGEEMVITATVLPANATNKSIIWASSNPAVAEVVEGKVSAINAGTTVVTASTEDGSITASCKVTVHPWAVESVNLDKAEVEIYEGEEYMLTATVIPANATNKNISWISSNENVATVIDGKVTALNAGQATITVVTEDGGKTAACQITVIEPTKATSLALSSSRINGYIYRDHSRLYDVSVTAYPENAVTDYEWTSSDTRVAKVSGYGSTANIYTEDYGESTITVTDRRTGLSASMTIHTLVEDFAWNEKTEETMYGYPMITLLIDEEYQLKYSHNPSFATKIFSDLEQFVFYEGGSVVGLPSCISITEDGLIKGVKTGLVGIQPTGLILKASNTGRIYINVISECTESEYNDEMSYADVIKKGAKMRFNMSNSNDIDIFKFTPPDTANGYFEIKLTYEGDLGTPNGKDKHLRWEMYNANTELFGSGDLSFKSEGSSWSISNKWLNTEKGYVRFYIKDYWQSYPSTIPTGDFIVEFISK